MNIDDKRKAVEDAIAKHNVTGYKWLEPSEIVVSQWVRMKCMYGCPDYGKILMCPPNAPTVDECRKFFTEYRQAVLLHFQIQVDDPDERHQRTKKINSQLLKLERDIFLLGFPKAFVLFIDPCNLCDICKDGSGPCENRKNARPSPEGFGVDVFSTARGASMPISVLTKYSESMNRYGILLID